MLSCLRSFAANDYVVETFVIDATSQPPLVGAVIKSGDISKITAKGFVVTTDRTKNTLEDALVIGEYGTDVPIECSCFDCSALSGREFTRRVPLLKSNTTYYIYSYIITDEGIHYSNDVTVTSSSFNRCSQPGGIANVFYAFDYTLFCQVSDEIINPSTDGFYYSTNEDPDYMGYQKGTSYNTCYKFKTAWNYKLWRYNDYRKEAPIQPEMSLSAKKLTMTTDKGASIYYCINGDGLRPENFTQKYTEPIDVEYGDVVYAYSISEQGCPSYTRAYKVLECLDDKRPIADDSFVKTYIMDGTSQPPVVGGIISDDFTGTISERGLLLTTSNIDFGYDGNSCADFQILDCSDVTTEGQFLVKLRRLKGNTKYYIRAYLKTNNKVYYGDIKEIQTQNFNRCNDSFDRANVWYAFSYTLFDLMSDEIINPSTEGFYYSTNENPTYCGYQKGTSYNTCYKYKTQWTYKLWYHLKTNNLDWGYKVNQGTPPIVSFKNGCITMSPNTADANKNVSIYYNTNGDYKRPENFTDVYSGAIKISKPSVIACYAKDGDEIISDVIYFVVTQDMLNKNINLVDKTPYAREESTDEYLNINYIRTFGNTNWQALYIPFSMSYNDWKDDFEIAYINNIRQLDTNDDGTIDKTIMDIVKVKKGSLIPNTPYLIKAKTTGEKTLSVNNATLYEAKENSIDCRTTIAEYTFTGTYSTIPAATLIENKYYAMGGGALIMTDGDSDLLPYRWYMKMESRNPMYNVDNAAKSITINVVDEEREVTGIEESRMTNDISPVYDLNGRKVSENNLKPGIYIKNGKKFVVK